MNAPAPQSRILTLVFTDLAGSTLLKTQLGDRRSAELIARHRELVATMAAGTGGRIIDWAGDGCFLTFETPSAAVTFALHVQQRHADQPELPRVRTGIHMGEVSETVSSAEVDGPPRVEGLAVDLTARICGLSEPGQILVSAAVADSARQRLEPQEFRQPVLWRAHGAYALKGFEESLQIREVGLDGLAPLKAPAASEKAAAVATEMAAQADIHKTAPVAGEQAMPSTPAQATFMRRTGRIVVFASITVVAIATWYLWSHPSSPTSSTANTESPVIPASRPLAAAGFDDRPAIAVLPFDNLSGDPEQEYFADGLAEDLITRLSLFRSFPVIARNSSFVFKGKAVDIKAVSADLGARYVVEGSVRKSGRHVRIVAQLIDASTGEHVWTQTYDRELTEVFVIQDEISSGIAASIVGDMQRAEQSRVARREPGNLEAWSLYQRGLTLLYRFTREEMIEARRLLERSVTLDPQFAPAQSKLAEAMVWQVAQGWVEDRKDTLDLALAVAQRAASIDPRDPSAHISRAFALSIMGQVNPAVAEVKLAIGLNPSDVLALQYAANLFALAGRPPEESLQLVERAMRLSPHDPMEFIYYEALAIVHFCSGRFEEMLEAARRLISLRSTYFLGYVYAAMSSAELGRSGEAREFVRQAKALEPGLSFDIAHAALGGMAPDVDRRVSEAMRKAGFE